MAFFVLFVCLSFFPQIAPENSRQCKETTHLLDSNARNSYQEEIFE